MISRSGEFIYRSRDGVGEGVESGDWRVGKIISYGAGVIAYEI